MPVVRGHFTYTQRDLKYAIEHDQYLEHLVPCLCNTHIHTLSHIPNRKTFTLSCFTEPR